MTYKIAIGIPSRDTWKAKFGMSFSKLLASSVMEGHEIVAINERYSTVVRNRNTIVKKTLANNCEYLLFLDDDMVFPHDALHILLSHKKDIVGCNYSKKIYPARPTASGYKDDKGLEEATWVGGGVLLIHRNVLDSMKYPYFKEDLELGQGEDVYFCMQARALGFPVFVDHDLSKEIKHIGDMEYVLG